MRFRNCVVAALAAAAVLASIFLYLGRREPPLPLPAVPRAVAPGVADVASFQALDNGRWTRTFRAADGTLYLRGRLLSRDGGRTVEPQVGPDVEDINAVPERAVLARPGLFYALGGPAGLVRPGVYEVRAWRSTDELRTLRTETVRIEVPEGPRRDRQGDEWYGLYVYRTIIEMPDGSWLMTMYGNFEVDKMTPPDRSSQREVKFMMRAFVVVSRDQGRSWRYLSTIASPRPGDPIGEGFVEPALTRLPDGRLLSVLRTGHHYPLYAVWSGDGGKSWTEPVYTGLDRGADPGLISLADGRVALIWGRRYTEGWSRLDEVGDPARFDYPGKGIVNLALSEDGGQTWTNHRIAQGMGSCYSTIFEVEPSVLFLQVDQWVTRVTLRPREVKAKR